MSTSRWTTIVSVLMLALIGAYELLMREFRANAAGVRSAYAGRTHNDEGPKEVEQVPASPEDQGRPPLHVVPIGGSGDDRSAENEGGRGERLPPQVQREAWEWALKNRHPDGFLPTGGEIAHRFGRKERWGRLIKQWGQQGRLGPSSEPSLTEVT